MCITVSNNVVVIACMSRAWVEEDRTSAEGATVWPTLRLGWSPCHPHLDKVRPANDAVRNAAADASATAAIMA